MTIELIFGNCIDAIKNIPDEYIDLVVTDPPYGIKYKSGRQTVNGRSGKDKVTGKSQYFDEIKNDDKFPVRWAKEVFRVLKMESAIYVFCHWKIYTDAKQEMESAGFELKNLIVLNKSNHGMGDLRGSYAPKHELLMFAVKGRHLLNFPNGREKDVWNVSVKYSGAKRLHPNEKPVSWILPAILNSSNLNDIILDPFMGSGTVGVACKKLHRNFIGIELDKKYFKIAQERIYDH
jgi:site-specific DNA-methyltransferase (adenine-specific)